MPCFNSRKASLVLAVQLLSSRALAQTSTGGTTGPTALAESDFSIYIQVKSASGSWTELGPATP